MSPDEQQNPEPGKAEKETAPLKQLENFHQFMHECMDCQKETEPHWQFCAHCGSRLATKCPGCGTPLPPAGSRSCPHCGLVIPQES